MSSTVKRVVQRARKSGACILKRPKKLKFSLMLPRKSFREPVACCLSTALGSSKDVSTLKLDSHLFFWPKERERENNHVSVRTLLITFLHGNIFLFVFSREKVELSSTCLVHYSCGNQFFPVPAPISHFPCPFLFPFPPKNR